MKLDLQYLQTIEEQELNSYQPFVDVVHQMITEKTGLGNDFLGWYDLPNTYDKEEFARINKAATKIQSDSEVLVVIGIGGSYLGAKAVIDYVKPTFATSCNDVEIIFAGQNISSDYLQDLLNHLAGRDFSINVISKSGTTTEPAIAFRILKQVLIERYGEQANERIYVTTDKAKGALKKQAQNNGWESFIVPDDVGGRFSVLTAVGLLPIAAAGIDVDQLLKGASEMKSELASSKITDNIAYQYAVIRNSLYKSGKTTEILVGYEPNLQYFNEWWKQLFGESEGKDHKGIFPASVLFSTDLHSLGQYIQDGQRNIFETVINIEKNNYQVKIPKEEQDLDQLNYLYGKTMQDVNSKAFEATAIAHNTGGVPNVVINVEDKSAYTIGKLIFFFELSCAASGYLLGVNPFDQPGVEEYKKNMFDLLGKSKN